MMDIQTKIRYEKMRLLIGNVEDKVVLDVGSGKSPISNGIKTKKTFCLDGVKDYSPDIVCDISKGFPIEDDCVDLIIAGEIIEHMNNPYKFMRECNRVLKKDGIIILSTPNICSLKSRIKVLFGGLPESCAEPLDIEGYNMHVVDFNFYSLNKVFKESRIEIVEKKSNGIISHNRLLFPLSLTPMSFGQTLIVKGIKKGDEK